MRALSREERVSFLFDSLLIVSSDDASFRVFRYEKQQQVDVKSVTAYDGWHVVSTLHMSFALFVVRPSELQKHV